MTIPTPRLLAGADRFDRRRVLDRADIVCGLAVVCCLLAGALELWTRSC